MSDYQLSLTCSNVDDSWYYDLTNKQWEFIQITAEGWYKVKNAIIFHDTGNSPSGSNSRDYPPDILTIYQPVQYSRRQEPITPKVLHNFIIISGIPKVILNLHGEQGATKTTLQELIKMLVDRNPMKTSSLLRTQTSLSSNLHTTT